MSEPFHKLKTFVWYLRHPGAFINQTKLKRFFKKPLLRLKDFWHNSRTASEGPYILFLREYYIGDDCYDHFLKWIKTNHPAINKKIRLARLKNNVDLNQIALYVPWLQNVQKDHFPENHKRAVNIERQCKEKNIPVINDLVSSDNITKSKALNILKDTGIRTAKVVSIPDPDSFDPKDSGLTFPFFIREDYLHNKQMDFIKNADDLAKVNWKNYHCPIAVEYIDVQDPDGLYRKYRYVLIGDRGIPRHLLISRHWFVHIKDRVLLPEYKEEELRYINGGRDPNHECLNKARKALGLDIVSFDYSYLKDGTLVVWEPNALSAYWTKENEKKYYEYLIESTNTIYKELVDYYSLRSSE